MIHTWGTKVNPLSQLLRSCFSDSEFVSAGQLRKEQIIA